MEGTHKQCPPAEEDIRSEVLVCLLSNLKDLFFQGRQVAESEFHSGNHQRRRVHLHLQQCRGHPRPGGNLPGGPEKEVQVCGCTAGQPQPQ